MSQLATVWARIRVWAETYAPESLLQLNPPARDESLMALEEAGIAPRELLASLALHDGTGALGPLPIRLLSADQILAAWQGLNQTHKRPPLFFGVPPVEAAILPKWWHPGWLPFTDSGAGDHLCVDTVPDATGVPGQVITYFHDLPDRRVAAPSFSEWLQRQADALEGGEYVATADEDGFYAVLRKADLYGPLADLTIRNEAVPMREPTSPADLAWNLVRTLQDQGQIEIAEGTFLPGAMWPVADALSSGLHAAVIHRTLACAPGVEGLDASVDDIDQLLTRLR